MTDYTLASSAVFLFSLPLLVPAGTLIVLEPLVAVGAVIAAGTVLALGAVAGLVVLIH
jgi:hypothetical protein